MDPTPAPGGDYGEIVRQLRDIKDRLSELESPSGTQRYQSVSKLSGLIEDIQQQLADFIANDVQAIVDARIAIALASYFAGNISIGGSLLVNGTVTVPGARSTQLSSAPNRVTAWIAGDGRLGHTS